MYWTKPMKVIQQEMAARKRAQKKAVAMSFTHDIQTGIIKLLTLWSILVSVALPSLGGLWT